MSYGISFGAWPVIQTYLHVPHPIVPKLLKSIAKSLWKDVGSRHKHQLDKAEIGITDDIIYAIVRYAKHNPYSGIRVWKAKNEHKHGHDIDLFIEDVHRRGYYWFPLQAKVLRQNKGYDNVKSKAQWKLLTQLKESRKAAGVWCQPYYLLYNGFSRRCFSKYASKHVDTAGYSALGCTLVDVELMESVCAGGDPKYSDFHTHRQLAARPIKVLPWHELPALTISGVMAAKRSKAVTGLVQADVLESRARFYDEVVETPPEAPASYFYYYGDAGTASPDEEGFGRYTLIIDQPNLLDIMLNELR